jgi:hypothetical protein
MSVGLLCGVGAPFSALAGLTIIPALTVSETYYSNAFFAAGGTRSDFTTTVSPELRAEYKGRPLEGDAYGIFSVTSFVENPSLNYGAASGGLSLNLNQLIGKLDKRARLQVSENVNYTPDLPAFVIAAGGFNPFASGIKTQRIRTFAHTASASGGYALTPRVDLGASYSYSFINFGNAFDVPQGVLVTSRPVFRTTFHSASGGPSFKVSPVDSVSLNYTYSKAKFNGGDLPGYETQGGTVGYSHVFSPNLRGGASAGVSSVSTSKRVSIVGDVSASWQERNTTTRFSFSRSILPSFAVVATSLESNNLSVSVSHPLTELLSAGIGAGYARSSASGTDLLFESYTASLSLSRTITRWLTGSFSYSHGNFTQEFGGVSSSFHNDQVSVSLRAVWR